jgi:hypothetical protein
MPPTIIVITVAIVAVLIAYYLIKERAKRAPRGTLADVVGPTKKDKMVEGREYCWLNYDDEAWATTVTYYDRDSQRVEKLRDPSGRQSIKFRETLYQAGWSRVSSSGHRQGHDDYYDRVKQPNRPL